jgi:4-amino-4-deoxy-L-arabinose transferase-like glycosyltransferase
MKNKLLLIIILIVASVLRLYQLGNVPVSPDWDEAALGYNAYSILETGKDEYGKPFPIILQSFADYKPALYMYLAIPSVALFGLDTFAVRLPSAIFGILTVFATYFLVVELFKRKDLALLASFLLAISPWHIQFSRVAFEANVGVALNIFGLLFFLKGLKKPLFLSLSAVFFGLSLYIYQSQKVFTPLFVLLLIIIYRKELFAVAKKYLIMFFVVGILIVLPMLTLIVTDKQALARAKGVSIFSVETPYSQFQREKYLEDKLQKNNINALFHHKYITYGQEVATGYLAHFDLKWLFLTGDLERHHAPNMGLLYLWELPFLL